MSHIIDALNMKILPFIIIFSCCALLGCNNKPADKQSDTDITKRNIETPTKKIEEQYSSSDNISITDKEVEQIEAPVEKLADKPKLEPKKPIKKEKPIASNTIEERATFVKTVSKPKVVAKKRAAEIKFEEYAYDFGEIIEGDKIEHKFTFTNTGNAPLTITKADATCGCATPSIPFMDIMPGESGYIGIMYNSVGKEGEETPQVTIYSNAGEQPILILKLKGFIKSKEEAKKEVAVKDSIVETAKDTTKTESN